MKQEYICEFCNEVYIPKNKNFKYCGRTCTDKAKTKNSIDERICKICDKHFFIKKSKKNFLCSRECAEKWKVLPDVSKNRGEKYKKTIKNNSINDEMWFRNRTNKMRKTKLDRYGKENYSNPKKCKETKLKRYGDENYSNKEKLKKTKFDRYCNENYVNVEKCKNTCIEKYGIENWMKTEDGRNLAKKMGNTYGFGSDKFKKYLKDNNITNISQLPQVKEKVQKKNWNMMYKKFSTIFKDEFEPLFTIDNYSGFGNGILYDFKCLKCDTTFKSILYSGISLHCPQCNPILTGTSHYEIELKEFLSNYILKDDIIMNTKSVLKGGYELDIYIPSKNMAIEFNGIYWHSENSGGKDKNYHLRKTKECKELGINLIHIFESEWINKRHVVEEIIKSKLGIFERRIYGRQTTVKEITSTDKNMFLETYHIQGKDLSTVKLGLYYNTELVSVMTFSKSRYNRNIEWEISRFVNKSGDIILGGASKLFNHFIKTYNPQSIITYSDIRYFNGDVYDKLGFTFIEDTNPNYFYFLPKIDELTLRSRIQFQKHKLKDLLKEYNDDMTEFENMTLNGYDRIWDCGNKKYIWKKD